MSAPLQWLKFVKVDDLSCTILLCLEHAATVDGAQEQNLHAGFNTRERNLFSSKPTLGMAIMRKTLHYQHLPKGKRQPHKTDQLPTDTIHGWSRILGWGIGIAGFSIWAQQTRGWVGVIIIIILLVLARSWAHNPSPSINGQGLLDVCTLSAIVPGWAVPRLRDLEPCAQLVQFNVDGLQFLSDLAGGCVSKWEDFASGMGAICAHVFAVKARSQIEGLRKGEVWVLAENSPDTDRRPKWWVCE